MRDILGVPNADYINSFFSANTVHSQAKLDSLANSALSRGIDFYENGNYEQAINSFKSSAALSPFSDNSAKAYDYIAKSYKKLDKTAQAIATYKEAISIYPVRDDLHLALGDIYMQEGMQEEALTEYEAAVRFNPDSNEARYSLGQSYLTAGKLDDSRAQFQAVARLTPASATGYYGLGQVARAEGDMQDAVFQFKKAISVNKDFLNSYRDLGYAYADMGDFYKANEQYTFLAEKNIAEATQLLDYISQVQAPKIVSVRATNGFNKNLGPGTSVSQLSSRLSDPGSSKIFSLNFAFSKDMDRNSVTNPYNWTISRASIIANSGVYNGGLPVPETEASISPIPLNIIYNELTNTATIQFKVLQNDEGNATIDPRHIVFKFSGEDAYGKAMDLSADEFSGFFSNKYNNFSAIA